MPDLFWEYLGVNVSLCAMVLICFSFTFNRSLGPGHALEQTLICMVVTNIYFRNPHQMLHIPILGRFSYMQF